MRIKPKGIPKRLAMKSWRADLKSISFHVETKIVNDVLVAMRAKSGVAVLIPKVRVSNGIATRASPNPNMARKSVAKKKMARVGNMPKVYLSGVSGFIAELN